jgi:hypothetical protein
MLKHEDRIISTPELTTTESAEKINLNAAATAFLAGGIGSAVFGLIVLLADAVPSFKEILTLSKDVGDLSGKVVFGMTIWLVTWIVLHFSLKNRTVDFNKCVIAGLFLVALGLLLSFPPFFLIFAAGD